MSERQRHPEALPEEAVTRPYATIWVKRPTDERAWCWGGNYDDPTGAASGRRLEELRALYPAAWLWELRLGDDA